MTQSTEFFAPTTKNHALTENPKVGSRKQPSGWPLHKSFPSRKGLPWEIERENLPSLSSEARRGNEHPSHSQLSGELSKTDFRRIPVMMVSSSELQSDIDRAFDLGANAYLVKPVSVQKMQSVFQVTADFWTTVSEWPSQPPQLFEAIPIPLVITPISPQ